MGHLDRQELAAIFAGGAIGAVLRVWLVQHFAQAPADWPWTIFIINITGSFALGYFAARLQERLPQSTYRRPLLGTGLCAGLSTFSTMPVEIVRMLDAQAWLLAAGYAAASVAGGYAAIRLATALARRVRVRA
jgi:CrcB protein